MSPRRLVILLAAAAVMMFILATSANAHSQSHSCGNIKAAGARYSVTVVKGGVSCKRAEHVLSDFLNGGGKMHGPKNGPSYKQYWTVLGWHCGHGAGSGGCSRHGSAIDAVWVANVG